MVYLGNHIFCTGMNTQLFRSQDQDIEINTLVFLLLDIEIMRDIMALLEFPDIKIIYN